MKQKNILKAIGIMFIVYIVLSWIIPGGSFQEATFTKDATNPLGLLDFIMYPIATIFSTNFAGVSFFAFGVAILFIGGLYGVMNKTGVYQTFVEKVVKKFKKKRWAFLLISTLIFAIFASLTTLPWPLLVLVPFFITVINKLGYDKVTSFFATVGAILVGNLATVFGYQSESVNYFKVLFANNATDLLQVKISMFVVCLGVLLLFLLTRKPAKRKVKKTKTSKTTTKNDTVEEVKEDKYLLFYEGTSKKKVWPMITVVSVLVLLTLIGMYNWAGAFDVKVFSDINKAISSFKINNYALFADLIGTNNAFFQFEIGKWGFYNFILLLLLSSLIIAKSYKLTMKDAFDGFKQGMIELLPTALVVVLANLIYLVIIVTFTSNKPLFFNNIAHTILGTSKKLNFFKLGFTTVLGSTMFNELPYLAMILQQPLVALYSSVSGLVQVILSSVFGFMMLILPTSPILVAGLGLSDLSLKDYFKGSYKVLIGLLIAITLVTMLFMYCPGIKVM